MELQRFITTAIKAIGKGIEEGGKEGNISSGNPWIGRTDQKGVEFDLCIATQEDKIYVTYPIKDVNLASRIKFAIPITIG